MYNKNEKSHLESMSPHEWGMPEKFNVWRPGQANMVEDIIDSPTVFKASCAPAGAGKSVSYHLAAKLTGARTCILTATKGLQNQLIGDFSSIGLVDIRGKNNYDCNDRMMKCDEAWPVCKSRLYGECPYKQAYEAACKAPLVVTNYSCWLNRNKMGGGAFTKATPEDDPLPFDMLVMDEAHEAPEELSKFIAVDLTDEDMVRYMKANVPNHTLPMKEWKEYATLWLPRIKGSVGDMEAGMKAGMKFDDKELRDYNQLSRIHSKLQTLATCNPDMWTVEPRSGNRPGFSFDPVWPGNYSRHLFQEIPKVVMVSATLRPKTMYLLGLKDNQFTFDEYPSPFSPNDAPIYHIPTARIRWDSSPVDLRAIYSRIDQIIRPRLDRKGLIHSVSYKRALEIVQASEYREYMMTNTRGIGSGLETTEVVAKFRGGKAPLILVSPSVSTGYDFPGSMTEFNILPKLPFPDSRSAVMKERIKRDPEYSNYLTAQQIVQACGRGNRYIGDRCQTFILDDAIKWFAWHNKHLFPKYFFDFYRTSQVIPKPLPRM